MGKTPNPGGANSGMAEPGADPFEGQRVDEPIFWRCSMPRSTPSRRRGSPTASWGGWRRRASDARGGPTTSIASSVPTRPVPRWRPSSVRASPPSGRTRTGSTRASVTLSWWMFSSRAGRDLPRRGDAIRAAGFELDWRYLLPRPSARALAAPLRPVRRPRGAPKPSSSRCSRPSSGTPARTAGGASRLCP